MCEFTAPAKYEGELGMVVKIKDDRVTLLSDATNEELTVFGKDLRIATDTSIAVVGGKYELYDLVQLDATTVACVVRVDRESLKVVDQTGAVRLLFPSQISNKLERKKFASSTDKDGNEIRIDDTIKEVIGEQRSGRVQHIHRIHLFCQNRQQTENAGIFVTRNNAVITMAAKGARAINAGPDLNKMNPNMLRGGINGAPAMAPPPGAASRYRGKTVKITRGQYKGLVGIVKDTTDTTVRVELHSKSVLVTIDRRTSKS